MALKTRISLPFILLTLAFHSTCPVQAQDWIISGIVTDTTGSAVANATVYLPSEKTGALTDENGLFSISPQTENDHIRIIFSCIGYTTDTLTVSRQDNNVILAIVLKDEVVRMRDISVTAFKSDQVTAIKIPVDASAVIPSVSAGIEAVVQTLPGVASFSELSYQYSVRGGSYDENLVYINDIEIYKPYLVRSGQQEGLSQINPDLTASISFSPGGFSAMYGDRLSSVLDIKYRNPSENEASVSLSLLTSSAHLGLVSSNKRFHLLTGLRYRSNAIILRGLEVKGNYRPVYTDLQTQAIYEINSHSHILFSLWGSSNRYIFEPESQTTTFGSLTSAYKLYAAFEGGERDLYNNLSGALTYEIKHNDKLTTKVIFSGQSATENENFDIRGAYSLRSLDESEQTKFDPDSLMNVGIGSWLDHARNRLESGIFTLTYRGAESSGNNMTEWGITTKYRRYKTKINEWLRVDSAGYTLGRYDEGLTLTSYSNSEETYRSICTEFFLNTRTGFSFASRQWDFNAGMRAVIDTYNDELLISPRTSLRVLLSDDLAMHLSLGAYHQLPGGREMMRKMEGVTTPLKAQRSYHLTTGIQYDFLAWDRPFRFTAELYGKMMERLIPYTVDNVRLVYYGGNIADGYSAGLDLRVNGEFVEGTESWFSLSLMKSEMRIPSKQSGWFPSPFDQRVNIDIFFQDYLPSYPDFRAHVNIVFGTGIPTSPDGSDPWDIWFRMPPYRRIDIGFSKVLIGKVKGRDIGKQGSAFKELIAGVEVFNLADIKNTISYTWIKSVNNSDGISISYAVPNYLTSRSLNVRLTARF